jgi:hypothetical protein
MKQIEMCGHKKSLIIYYSSNLAKHIREQHKKFRPNSCIICAKRKYERPDSLRDHLYQHVDVVLSSFECQAKDCAQKFRKLLFYTLTSSFLHSHHQQNSCTCVDT